MKYLFIDESGDHNMDLAKVDPQFPLFVLTGVVFDSSEYLKFSKDLLRFKQNIFNNKNIVLHSGELTRPNITKQKELRELTNFKKRSFFYKRLDELIDKSKFDVLIYSMDKVKLHKSFGSVPPDPYFLSFINIYERFHSKLKFKEHGKVFTEQRNPILDKQFLLAWESSNVTNKRKALKPTILSKSWRHSGLELADLISYRISRHLLNKPVKPTGNEIGLKIILKKDAQIEGFKN